MSARIAMFAFVAAMLALHGVVSYLAPLGTDDWDIMVWIAQHRHDDAGEWLSAFFSRFHTLADLANFAITRHPIVHAFLTPLVTVATVLGVFALAARRLPRLVWEDVAGVVVIAAVLWIAAPRCGITYFHRPHAATWLYGTAMTAWFLAPLRCGWRVRTWHLPLLVLAGLLAGSSTRQLGLLATGATIYAIVKSPKRELWMWIALAAIAIGTAVGFHRAMFDYRGLRPGFEVSLVALNLAVFEGGELISLVGGLVLVKIVVGTLWPQHAGTGAPDTTETLRWIGVWFAYAVVALLGPRYNEASLFPAACLLAIAAYPIGQWVVTSRPLRVVVIGTAVAINLVAWSMALSRYVPLNAQFRERIATVRAAKRGSVPVVNTYSQIRPEFWAYGEDWNDAARRQYVARALYKLGDVEMSPAFRRLELNPRQLELRLESTGLTPEQLTAAGAPEKWPTTLRNARTLFDDLVAKVKAPGPFTLRLVVDKLPFDVLRGRPLIAASFEAGQRTSIKIRRTGQDEESRIAILPTPASFGTQFTEAYTVIGGRAEPVKFERKRYWIPTLTTELHAIVACDPARCFLVDAFIPAL